MTTSEAGDRRLLELCLRWQHMAGSGEWSLEVTGRGPVRLNRGRSYVRLPPWQACLMLLLIEAGEFATEINMLVAIRPGWRVRPSESTPSLEHAREAVLARVRPRGPWSWTEEPARRTIDWSTPMPEPGPDCAYVGRVTHVYRGRLRWYEDDPAPSKRRYLSERACEWRDHATVYDDWLLEGGPGECPVPAFIARVPELGEWLEAMVERRDPDPSWFGMIALRLEAISRRPALTSGF